MSDADEDWADAELEEDQCDYDDDGVHDSPKRINRSNDDDVEDDEEWGSVHDDADNDDDDEQDIGGTTGSHENTMIGSENDGVDVNSKTSGPTLDWRVRADNLFYEADDQRRRDPPRALTQFRECVSVLDAHMQHGREPPHRLVPTLQRIACLSIQLEDRPRARASARRLLQELHRPHLAANERALALDALLTAALQKCADSADDVVEEALVAIDDSRLQLRAGLRVATAHLESGRFDRAAAMLPRLEIVAASPQLTPPERLDLAALRVQLLAEEGRPDLAAQVAATARASLLGIEEQQLLLHAPRAAALLRECWAEAHAAARRWNQAYTLFWDAFLALQAQGHVRARPALAGALVASMMLMPPQGTTSSSTTTHSYPRPLDATEARVMGRDPALAALLQVQQALEQADWSVFAAAAPLVSDQLACIDARRAPMLWQVHFPELKRKVQSRVLLSKVACCSRVQLNQLAQVVGEADAEPLLPLFRALILDGALRGRLNAEHGVLEMLHDDRSQQQHVSKTQSQFLYNAVHARRAQSWSDQLAATSSRLERLMLRSPHSHAPSSSSATAVASSLGHDPVQMHFPRLRS